MDAVLSMVPPSGDVVHRVNILRRNCKWYLCGTLSRYGEAVLSVPKWYLVCSIDKICGGGIGYEITEWYYVWGMYWMRHRVVLCAIH